MIIPSLLSKTAAVLSIAGTLLIAGCSATPPAHLRMLNALPRATTATPPTLKLQVLPVTVAEYLDRAELVRRTSTNELALSTDDVWAERLSSNIGRVLASDLSALVPADVMATTPIGDSLFAGQVSLDVSAFEIDADGSAVFDGRWSLIDPATRQTLISEPLHFTSLAGGASETSAVAGLNQTLDQASERIANEIRALISTGKLSQPH